MASELEVGVKLHAKYWDGAFYPAEVVAVSEARRRTKAPVKVHFVGYGADADTWLPLADLKSKRLEKIPAKAKGESQREEKPKARAGQRAVTLPASKMRTDSAFSVDGASPQRSIRKMSSFKLDASEDAAVFAATAKFDVDNFGRQTSDVAEPGYFGDRDNWAHHQELLIRVKALYDVTGANPGELQTETDLAVAKYDKIVLDILKVLKRHITKPKMEAFVEDTFVNPALKGCVFVGHVATDLDSIAGAIGAAELFGGIATKSQADLNGEIQYALKEIAKLDEPPLFDDVPGCAKADVNGEFKKVCLVDHNEVKQMVGSLRNDPNRKKRIVGVIDHHALSESFSSQGPLLIDIRPWGSMSSIVGHMYVRSNSKMRPEIARLLMCAILSDTLNLQSVTTTDADRFAVALLAKIGGVDDPDEVARLMFREKTRWVVNLGPYAMVRGDQKDFSSDGWKYGIAVLEVTDMTQVLEKAEALIIELRALKIEKGGGKLENELDFAFLFVVDVVKQRSVMLVCGGREYALAKAAFPNCRFGKAHPTMKQAPGKTINAEQTLCDVGPLVSRKAQFEPTFYTTLSSGFECHKAKVSSPDYKEADEDKALTILIEAGHFEVVLDDHQMYERTPHATKGAADLIFGA